MLPRTLHGNTCKFMCVLVNSEQGARASGKASSSQVKGQVQEEQVDNGKWNDYRNQVWVRVLSRQNLALVIQTGHLLHEA